LADALEDVDQIGIGVNVVQAAGGDQALGNTHIFCPDLGPAVERREHWLQEYSLDVQAEQIRPQAESAFRQGGYAEAAELYGLMRERLSPAEAKKLALAERRRVG